MSRLQFMIHDRWENVLFVHYKVATSSLEYRILQELSPFMLDVVEASDADGEASRNTGSSCSSFVWLGLVFLTERNVGPGFARDACGWLRDSLGLPTLITHHGINVRTYVEGDGIFFYSLECDSRLATSGANVFGIPYRFAKIAREFAFHASSAKGNGTNKPVDADPDEEGQDQQEAPKQGDADDMKIMKTIEPVPKLCSMSSWRGVSLLSRDVTHLTSHAPSSQGISETVRMVKDRSETSRTSAPPAFGFDCVWQVLDNAEKSLEKTQFHAVVNEHASSKIKPPERSVKGSELVADGADESGQQSCWESNATFLTERYKVYSVGAPVVGPQLVGSVHHDPWPKKRAKVEHIRLWRSTSTHDPCVRENAGDEKPQQSVQGSVTPPRSGPPAFGETNMKTVEDVLDSLVNKRRPDHVCFSSGVGPVCFDPLQPWTRR
ncbi:unnamed protein product [Amoebophrya sp. A25]|nr:unnamed protein product [Amoebophrya sp. A25]|eukprot:GSA25T00001993001.1